MSLSLTRKIDESGQPGRNSETQRGTDCALSGSGFAWVSASTGELLPTAPKPGTFSL